MNKKDFLIYGYLGEIHGSELTLDITDDGIFYLVASGNLLNRILEELSGIPKPLKFVRQFGWYGDFALIIKDYLVG